MKAKKFKKIIKKELHKFKKNCESVDLLEVPSPKNTYNDYIFSDSSEEIKQQSRTLFFGLLNLRDHLRINISDTHISIHSENGFKNNNNNNNVYNNSLQDYFDLDIIKDTGYIMNFKNKRLAFKDETIYQDVLEKVTKTFTDLNISNFSELYNDIMVEAGLARETNLKSLFS
jgi:hypothetical protein